MGSNASSLKRNYLSSQSKKTEILKHFLTRFATAGFQGMNTTTHLSFLLPPPHQPTSCGPWLAGSSPWLANILWPLLLSSQPFTAPPHLLPTRASLFVPMGGGQPANLLWPLPTASQPPRVPFPGWAGSLIGLNHQPSQGTPPLHEFLHQSSRYL